MTLYNPSLSAPMSTIANPMQGFTVGTPYHGQTISRAQLAVQYNRNRYYTKQRTPKVNCQCRSCNNTTKCPFCTDTHEGAYCCDHRNCTIHPGKACPK